MIRRALLILLFVMTAVLPVYADEQQGETVNVQEVIFGHLKDSYEWHVMSWGGHHVSIPLPVIVKSTSTGWHCFSSRHLRQGAEYKGFMVADNGRYVGKVVEVTESGEYVRPFDMSFTKTACAITINSLVLLCIILGVGRWYKKHDATDTVPGGFVGLIELLIQLVSDGIIKPSIGKDYKRYESFLLTMFFFIFFTNLIGLIPIFPAGANVTGNIAVTAFLALLTFIAVNLFGNREYWKDIFWPDVPIFLKCPMPLMPLIELFGIFTKPFALTVRLFANMMAGHAVILALTCVIFITARMGVIIGASMSFVSVLFMVFMNMLELLVAYIQAYVFTMLSAVFIGMSRQSDNEDKVSTK